MEKPRSRRAVPNEVGRFQVDPDNCVVLIQTNFGVVGVGAKEHKNYKAGVEAIVNKYDDGIFELKGKRPGSRIVNTSNKWNYLRIDLQKKNSSKFFSRGSGFPSSCPGFDSWHS